MEKLIMGLVGLCLAGYGAASLWALAMSHLTLLGSLGLHAVLVFGGVWLMLKAMKK